MQLGKHKESKTKIIILDAHFGRINSNIIEKWDAQLKADGLNRTEWIKALCKDEFGLDINTAADIKKLSTFMVPNIYEDKADWLRDNIRHYLKES